MIFKWKSQSFNYYCKSLNSFEPKPKKKNLSLWVFHLNHEDSLTSTSEIIGVAEFKVMPTSSFMKEFILKLVRVLEPM